MLLEPESPILLSLFFFFPLIFFFGGLVSYPVVVGTRFMEFTWLLILSTFLLCDVSSAAIVNLGLEQDFTLLISLLGWIGCVVHG